MHIYVHINERCVWRILFIRVRERVVVLIFWWMHSLMNWTWKVLDRNCCFPWREFDRICLYWLKRWSLIRAEDAHLFIALSTNILLIENVSMMPSRDIPCVCSSIIDGEYFNQFPLLHLKMRHLRSRDRWDSDDEEQQCTMEHLSVFRCDNRFSLPLHSFYFRADPSVNGQTTKERNWTRRTVRHIRLRFFSVSRFFSASFTSIA